MPRAFQGLSDYDGREIPAALSAIRKGGSSRDSLKSQCPCSTVERHLIFAASCGPRAGVEMSPHARAGGSEKRVAGTGRARGTQGLEPGRSQEQEKAGREDFQTPNLGAARREEQLALIPGLPGRKS